MKKKILLLLTGILLVSILFTACATKLPTPVPVDCPEDIFIPELSSNPSFLAEKDGVYEFLLEDEMTNVMVHFIDDESLIFSDLYYYVKNNTYYRFTNYYQYHFKTGELTPITAFLSSLYSSGDVKWAATNDRIWFSQNLQTPYPYYSLGIMDSSAFADISPYEKILYSYHPEENLLTEITRNDHLLFLKQELLGKDGSLYSLAGKERFFGAFTQTVITKYSTESNTSTRVLKKTVNNLFSSGEILLHLFEAPDGFAVLVQNQKSKALRLEYYSPNWKHLRSIDLDFLDSDVQDVSTMQLYGDLLLQKFKSNLKIFDLSSESPEDTAQIYLSFTPATVIGSEPETKLLLNHSSDALSNEQLHGISKNGKPVQYSFYPFVATGYSCISAMQNGNSVLLCYQEKPNTDFRYILTDLSTLEQYIVE